MKILKAISLTTLLLTLIFYSSCTSRDEAKYKDYTQYVNVFIGASDNGHTFPGACRPFGMIQTSPVTGAIGWQYCSEYLHDDTELWGFSQTHLNGTGCMDLGDILVMPVTGSRQRAWDGYRSTMNKASEQASPGYYTVELLPSKIKAELTSSYRVAFHRYTFQQADSASLLIDLQHAPAWNKEQYHSQTIACSVDWEDSHTLTGHVRNKVWVEQDYFFVMKFDRPVIDSISLPMAPTEKGKRIVASFDLDAGEQLQVKIALSTTGIEGAKKNLETEVPHWSFDEVKLQSKEAWNIHLRRVQAEGTLDELTNFYTSIYRTLIQPNIISDVDGYYRNVNDEVVRTEGEGFYSTFSLWDTYRAAHPWYTLIVPERVDGFVNSLIEQGEDQGFLPIWALWGKETYCMIGNHAVPVIAEAYRKGFRGFDAERAFAMIKQTQTVSHPQKSDWETYMRYGYFPTDKVEAESVSSTLESVYDDYAAADMARRLGKKEDANYFGQRALFYKNLFDKETQFMRPKKADGSWKTPFNPSQLAHAESIGGDYTEGNAWQYTWHVQHDVEGLIELFGGKKQFVTKLDSLFSISLGEEKLADVTGLIGQYAHGNEPSHHVTYLYALADKPSRTQELVREIFVNKYRNSPDGLCGNDDCGQMSAWYLFSAMGFYPVNPVSGEYVIGAPQLPQISLDLPNGKTFKVVAQNISTENKYVQRIYLNGDILERKYITHEEITQGGTLLFEMTDKPS